MISKLNDELKTLIAQAFKDCLEVEISSEIIDAAFHSREKIGDAVILHIAGWNASRIHAEFSVIFSAKESQGESQC